MKSLLYRGVVIYTQTHDGSFLQAAQLNSISLPQSIVASVDAFPLLIASGNHMSATSEHCDALNLRKAAGSQGSANSKTLVQSLQSLGGALPQWHPQILQLLLSSGRLAIVAKLLRSLLASLQKVNITRVQSVNQMYRYVAYN